MATTFEPTEEATQPDASDTHTVKPSIRNWLLSLTLGWILVIPPFLALWRWRKATRLEIQPDRLRLEDPGLLSTDTREVYPENIQTIDVSQSLKQRLLGVGDLRVDTAGQAHGEIHMQGIPDPAGVKERLHHARQQA